MGSHHVLECVVGTRRYITSRHQPGSVFLKKFGELQGTFHRRPPSRRSWSGQILNQLCQVGGLSSCQPSRAAYNAWLRICVPTPKALRVIQHAGSVHKLSVVARNG